MDSTKEDVGKAMATLAKQQELLESKGKALNKKGEELETKVASQMKDIEQQQAKFVDQCSLQLVDLAGVDPDAEAGSIDVWITRH